MFVFHSNYGDKINLMVIEDIIGCTICKDFTIV